MQQLMLHFAGTQGRVLLQRLFKCWWDEVLQAKDESTSTAEGETPRDAARREASRRRREARALRRRRETRPDSRGFASLAGDAVRKAVADGEPMRIRLRVSTPPAALQGADLVRGVRVNGGRGFANPGSPGEFPWLFI